MLDLLRSNALEKEDKEVWNNKKSICFIKFMVEEHKLEYPLRVVVNEAGTWQKALSRFLHASLSHARLPKTDKVKEFGGIDRGHHAVSWKTLPLSVTGCKRPIMFI